MKKGQNVAEKQGRREGRRRRRMEMHNACMGYANEGFLNYE